METDIPTPGFCYVHLDSVMRLLLFRSRENVRAKSPHHSAQKGWCLFARKALCHKIESEQMLWLKSWGRCHFYWEGQRGCLFVGGRIFWATISLEKGSFLKSKLEQIFSEVQEGGRGPHPQSLIIICHLLSSVTGSGIFIGKSVLPICAHGQGMWFNTTIIVQETFRFACHTSPVFYRIYTKVSWECLPLPQHQSLMVGLRFFQNLWARECHFRNIGNQETHVGKTALDSSQYIAFTNGLDSLCSINDSHYMPNMDISHEWKAADDFQDFPFQKRIGNLKGMSF